MTARRLRRGAAALLAGLLAATTFGTPAVQAADTGVRVTYAADTADIANPDRGLYHHNGDCDATTFDPAVLRAYRTEEHISLVMCIFYLDGFQNSPISQAALTHFQQQAATVRAAGLKMIVRFAYTQDMSGNDAPVARVLAHIDQLTPYLRGNADVIHVVQAGFIGAWGEWYYTQNFGNAGVISAADWANRKAVVDRLLSAVPATRQIQVRTPAFKRTLYGTAPASVPRIGHHNDCFLAADDDWGTYADKSVEYPYLQADTQVVAMGGETCNVNPPRSECPTALTEMRELHYTFLNHDYHPGVRQSWVDGGCFDQVRSTLGYRFTLVEGTYPARAAGSAAVRITVRNDGWAAPVNAHNATLVLRDTRTGAVHKRALTTDPRRWAAGTITTIAQTVSLSGIPAGSYQLFLELSDPALGARPEYSIRTANVSTWETATGFNNLRHTLVVG